VLTFSNTLENVVKITIGSNIALKEPSSLVAAKELPHPFFSSVLQISPGHHDNI
jgi:hypothetical protein